MKKTYINPEMITIKIQPLQMLVNSLEVVDEEGTTPTPGTTLSRSFGLEEDEEEY